MVIPRKTFITKTRTLYFIAVIKEGRVCFVNGLLVDYSEHLNLQVIPKPCSIEFSNDQITLAIILFVGFEDEKYEAIKNRENLHLVSFSDVVATMNEFRHLKVKYVDPRSWLFMILSPSSHPELVGLNLLKT